MLRRSLRFLAFALVSLFLLSGASCQAQLDGYAELDRLADQFSKKLKSEKSQEIAVADFVALEGTVAGQGHYFAEFFARSMQRHGKNLHIVDHAQFDQTLRGAHISLDSFTSPPAAAAQAAVIPEAIVVIGSVGRDETRYTFQITLVRVPNGQTLASGDASFARTEFVDSLSQAFPPKFDFPVLKYAPQVGMKNPTCIYCPDPTYSDRARADKLQGTVVFDTVVSASGVIIALRPVRLLGDGLDERAFETVRSWRLRPATDSAGNPVAVRLPIEVTFRLY